MAQDNAPHEGVFLFEMADRNGTMHQYESTPFGLDGIELAVEVRSMAAEPIARVLGSLGAMEAISHKIKEKGIDTDLGELFREVIKADIPWAEVARDVKSAFRAAGGPQLIRKVLRRTYRDGKPLSDDTTFGKAYGRNWNEMFLAAFKVAEWNDLMGFTFTSTDDSGADEAAPPETVGEYDPPWSSLRWGCPSCCSLEPGF